MRDNTLFRHHVIPVRKKNSHKLIFCDNSLIENNVIINEALTVLLSSPFDSIWERPKSVTTTVQSLLTRKLALVISL